VQDAIPPTLFVSDLHLTPERPAITDAFLRFLENEARGASSLYILGDLFDYWIGDDDLDDPSATVITNAIGALAESGCTVYVMHGNRDFLMGEKLCHAASALLLNDPTVVELGGMRTLLLHGDTLCIDDPDYMTFRNQVRDAAWQAAFLAKPLEERRTIAHGLRADSRSSQRGKTETIMDVAPRAVIEAFRRWACDRMIHGHTHRPGRHEHVVDGRTRERWVLADWYARGSCLEVDANGIATPRLLP
jgi:UDP-2,3-diacylglucosamine hydrolase